MEVPLVRTGAAQVRVKNESPRVTVKPDGAPDNATGLLDTVVEFVLVPAPVIAETRKP